MKWLLMLLATCSFAADYPMPSNSVSLSSNVDNAQTVVFVASPIPSGSYGATLFSGNVPWNSGLDQYIEPVCVVGSGSASVTVSRGTVATVNAQSTWTVNSPKSGLIKVHGIEPQILYYVATIVSTPTATISPTITNTPTFTSTASQTPTPTLTLTWTPTTGPLSDKMPVPLNAWAYSTGGEATLPSGTVSSSQHFFTLTGSPYRTIAIKRIKLALIYDNNGATGGINGSQPFQFSIRNPDSGPSTHFVNPSISKMDVNAPTSSAALTFNYTQPTTIGTSLGASEYSFLKITGVYEKYWSDIFPASTPAPSGVASFHSYSTIPVVWDDDNGRSPFIVRGPAQNFCISLPSSYMVGAGVTTYLDYDVEWVEY